MDEIVRLERSGSVSRTVALALGALLVANALALLIAGPAPWSPAGRLDRGLRTVGEGERSVAARVVGRSFVLVAFNTAVAAGLGFALVARRMESIRRRRLDLPDWLDERDVLPHLVGRVDRPPAAAEYRPSSN
jgi:hypothetical protein